ncbi:MAG: VWA domain-containing protein [Gammaproteobacteria bacterium]|nr:VWA domain-containing protein [Gammaproteobacteria bacterium]
MSKTRSSFTIYKPLVISILAMAITSVAQHALATQQPAIPKIQMAIILDTSNSMDGLINQTRNQLWQVVNEFSTARQHGKTPTLEIALYEYGNDGNSARVGYVRKLNGFTGELDAVSEGLFSLTTNGGSEFSGLAIQTAVNNLQWSQSDRDIKTIFIAGNEAFTQGPIDYRKAIKLAEHHGITINTIHAGNHQEGINDSWQAGAILAGGDYMSIDTDQQVVHIVAPQDKKIAELNARLNETYVPYGDQGKEKIQRQVQQDAYSSGISAGLLAKRAESKTSSFYRNSKWDLVDALEEGEVNEEYLLQLEDDTLPEPMKGLSSKQKLDYVQQKAAERESIKQEMAELSRSRNAYVAEKKRKQVAAAPSVGDALSRAVKKQAELKDYVFE